MSNLIRRLILPPIAAASLLVAAAGGALAASPSATVSVFNGDGTPAGATVCEFYVEFNPVAGGEDGSWVLWDDGGNVVDQGSYSVTASTGDRVPDSGTWSLDNGTYTLGWDNEDRVDNSRSEQDIDVMCETPSQSVAAETDVPSQSVAADTEKPSQDVEAETDNPTQPNTASVESQGRPDPNGWTGLLVALIGFGAFLLVLTPHRGIGRR